MMTMTPHRRRRSLSRRNTPGHPAPTTVTPLTQRTTMTMRTMMGGMTTTTMMGATTMTIVNQDNDGRDDDNDGSDDDDDSDDQCSGDAFN
jgi:hypothetical protein